MPGPKWNTVSKMALGKRRTRNVLLFVLVFCGCTSLVQDANSARRCSYRTNKSPPLFRDDTGQASVSNGNGEKFPTGGQPGYFARPIITGRDAQIPHRTSLLLHFLCRETSLLKGLHDQTWLQHTVTEHAHAVEPRSRTYREFMANSIQTTR